MQDEIWHQRSIQIYNGAVLSVYSMTLGLDPCISNMATTMGQNDGVARTTNDATCIYMALLTTTNMVS